MRHAVMGVGSVYAPRIGSAKAPNGGRIPTMVACGNLVPLVEVLLDRLNQLLQYFSWKDVLPGQKVIGRRV